MGTQYPGSGVRCRPGASAPCSPVDQLGLSPFVAGDLVQWWDARGRRTGRFIGVIARGPHRGTAEVAVGGALVEERIIRVPLADLAAAGSGRARARH